MNNIGLSLSRSITLVAVIFSGAISIDAQCQDATLKRAVADVGSKTISVELFPRITNKDQVAATDPRAWTLVDISPQSPAASPLQITSIGLAADRLFPNNFLSAVLDYAGTFDPTHHYVLSNVTLTFNGCKPSQPASTSILFELKASPPIASAKANGREDSDIYVAGQLEGSRKTRAIQTADIKIRLPIGLKNFLGRERSATPYFEMKASNSKKSDADSLKFGGSLGTVYNAERFDLFGHHPVTNIVWETDGRIEADRRFRNINALWVNTLSFIPPLLGESSNQKILAYIQPSIGFEVGRNLKSPLQAAEHRGLARATGGASLYLLFNTGNKLLDRLSFQTDYIRRWPLRKEVSFTEGDKGILLPLIIGRNPRDFVTSKIEIGINDFFGLAIGYDYGKLPPNFKLVDSHFTFGFVYKKRLIPRFK